MQTCDPGEGMSHKALGGSTFQTRRSMQSPRVEGDLACLVCLAVRGQCGSMSVSQGEVKGSESPAATGTVSRPSRGHCQDFDSG